MSVLTTSAIVMLTDKLIEKISGGSVIFYQGGSLKPNYVGHSLNDSIPVLSFSLKTPPAIMNIAEGKLYLQLDQQTLSYPNYCVPDFFRLYTSTGLAIYQGTANAFGRNNQNTGSSVVLISKMLDDEYETPDAFFNNNNFYTQYTRLPPNYKCQLSTIAISI